MIYSARDLVHNPLPLLSMVCRTVKMTEMDVDSSKAVVDLTQVTLDEGISSAVVPSAGLLDVLENEKYCDVTFVVDGEKFKAHRVILASQCEYFDRLLYGPLKEAKTDQIALQDTPAAAFQYLLRYLYTGQLETIDIQAALDLLCLADRYQLNELKSCLEQNLSHHLSISTIFQFLFYAEAYNCSDLHQICTTYIECNTHSVLCSEVILNLPYSHFKSFVSRDQLLVDEIEVFDTVQKWIAQNNPETREREKLLKCIRLSEISASQLQEKVASSGLFDKPVISKALEIQSSASEVKDGDMPRGRTTDSNLFADAATTIENYENFSLKVHPDFYGEAFRGKPSDYKFYILSRASHKVSSITLMLCDVFLVNKLKFEAYSDSWREDGNFDEIKEPFSYKIEVSKDSNSWMTVIDHSNCKCYFTQQLYFPRKAVQYIKLTIVRAHDNLQVRFLSCSCSSSEQEPQFRHSNGILAPLTPLTPAVINFMTVVHKGVRCFLTLHQPYSISSITLKVCGLVGSAHVVVSVSLVNKYKQYQVVADLKNCILNESDLQITFQERVVAIITVDILDFSVEGQLVPLSKDTPISIKNIVIGQAIVS